MKQNIHACATALFFFKLKAKSERLKAVGVFKLKAESLRLKAVVGQFSKKQLTNRLSLLGQKAEGSFKLKAESLKLKAVGKFSKKQLINRLPLLGQKAEGSFRLKAESLRLKAVIGQFSQKQLTNRLPLLGQKAEGLKPKAVGKFSSVQLTNRLPQPTPHNADASGFTMTGEGEDLQFNYDKPITQSQATGSAGPVKRRAGSLALWDEGSFYLDFFGYFFNLRKKVLSPRGGEREDSQHKDNNPNQPATTTPFNSPASGVHWAQTYQVGDIFKQVVCQLKQLLLTNRLPQPTPHNADASSFAMTGEGEAKQFSYDTPITQSQATGSAGSVKRRAGSMASGLKDRFTLIFWCLFHLRKTALAILSAEKNQTITRKKTLGPRGYERENYYTKESIPNQPAITTPFNSPASGGHWTQTYRVGDILKKGICQLSKKLFTNRLSLRPSAKASASLITMTGKGEEVHFNRSIPNSNDHSLPTNSALAVAVKVKDFLHYHCSNWRSGEFFWLLFLRKKLRSTLECLSKTIIENEKKLLALPPAMRREDYNSKNNFQNRDNRKPRQKILTNRLSLRPSAEPGASLITMTGRRRGSAVKLRPNILMVLLIALAVVLGKPAKSQTTALQIGDTIPEAVWNLPLKAVQHPKGKSTFTLKDYKDKLIILDFWATWCAPCIKSLGKLAKLQETFPADLAVVPVTYQDAKTATTFLKSKTNWLMSVVGETRLKAYFPYLSIPHQVWIKDGKVLAIPNTEYANEANIEKVLLDEEVKMVMKANIQLNRNKPLFIAENGGKGEQLLYQATLSGRINLRTSGGGANHSAEGNILLYINLTLPQLLLEAFGKTLNHDPKRILWETDSNTRILLTGERMKRPLGNYAKDSLYYAWLQAHTFCYNLFSKTPISSEVAYRQMQEDANRFAGMRYGVSAGLEQRTIPCLVLRKLSTSPKLATKGGEALLDLKSPDHYMVSNLPAATAFGRVLEKVMPQKLLIDESGITSKIDLQLSHRIDGNIKVANQELKAYGLKLAEEEMPLEMLIIKKINPTINFNP